MEFIQTFSGRKFPSSLANEDLEMAFDSMNLDKDGFILVRDLIDVLESYGGDQKGSASGVRLSLKTLPRTIVGYESMSPRTQ